MCVHARVQGREREGAVGDPGQCRSIVPGWARLPPHPTTTGHRAAVRGAGPAAKLLLFIHRLCLLRPLPSFRALPPPTPRHPGLVFWDPCVPGLGGGPPGPPWVTGLRTATHVRGARHAALRLASGAASLPVQRGPGTPSKPAPRGRVWAEGARACLLSARPAGGREGCLVCEGSQEGARNATPGEWGPHGGSALGHCGHCNIWPQSRRSLHSWLLGLPPASLSPGEGTFPREFQPRVWVGRHREGAPWPRGGQTTCGRKAPCIRPHDKSL